MANLNRRTPRHGVRFLLAGALFGIRVICAALSGRAQDDSEAAYQELFAAMDAFSVSRRPRPPSGGRRARARCCTRRGLDRRPADRGRACAYGARPVWRPGSPPPTCALRARMHADLERLGAACCPPSSPPPHQPTSVSLSSSQPTPPPPQ